MIITNREYLKEAARQYVRELDKAITAHDVILACEKFGKAIDPTGTVVSGRTGAFEIKTPEEQTQTWRRIDKPKAGN